MGKKLLLLLFLLVALSTGINAQTAKPPKPSRIKKTEFNKNDKCFLALFEIQDADDYLEQIKQSNNLTEIKKLLQSIETCFDDDELFSLLCPCIVKQQEVIWLMTDDPKDKIEAALKLNDIPKIKALVDEVSDDVFYILLFYNKCF
jgi:hypothetical protein